MKKIKRGYIFMALGLLFIIGAVALAGYNYYDDMRAGDEAHEVYEQIYEIIEQNIKTVAAEKNDITADKPIIPEIKTEKIKGREFIGIISIPAMKVELPVQFTCNDTNLRYSPCCYKGSFYDDTMIIAAHNYRSHFGRLSTLKAGDKVTFTDIDGINYKYSVYDVIYLDSTAVKEMEAGDDWDLTLFTCTFGNRQRITVRCKRIS